MRRVLFVIVMLLFVVVPSLAQQPVPLTSIYDALIEQPDFSEFVGYLETFAPDLVPMLQDTNNVWTIFVPSNGAFDDIESRFSSDADDFLENAEYMEALIRFHIVPGLVRPDNLSIYTNGLTIGTMLTGQFIRSVPFDSASVYTLNGRETTLEYAIEVTSGGIYIVDTPMIPSVLSPGLGYELASTPEQVFTLPDYDPSSRRLPDVLTALEQAGEFSYLSAFLQARPNLLARLEKGGYFTLFAAPDAAWEATLVDSYGADIEQLIDNPNTPDNFNFLDTLIISSILLGQYEPQSFERFTDDNSRFYTVTLGAGLGITRDPFADVLSYEAYIEVYFDPEPIYARNVLIYITDGMIEVG